MSYLRDTRMTKLETLKPLLNAQEQSPDASNLKVTANLSSKNENIALEIIMNY